jgi:hypothetical protein
MKWSSISVTQHYAHVTVDLFAESAFAAMTAALSQPAGDVVPLSPVRGEIGETIAATQQATAEAQLA